MKVLLRDTNPGIEDLKLELTDLMNFIDSRHKKYNPNLNSYQADSLILVYNLMNELSLYESRVNSILDLKNRLLITDDSFYEIFSDIITSHSNNLYLNWDTIEYWEIGQSQTQADNPCFTQYANAVSTASSIGIGIMTVGIFTGNAIGIASGGLSWAIAMVYAHMQWCKCTLETYGVEGPGC